MAEGMDKPAFGDPFDRMLIEATDNFPLPAYPGEEGVALLQCLVVDCDADPFGTCLR